MKSNLIRNGSLIVMMLIGTTSVQAQSGNPGSRFSHKGLKAAIGFGNFRMPSAANGDEHDGGLLSLGYGFTDRSTLWVSLTGTDNQVKDGNQKTAEFGGVELSFQYKFMPHSKLQPYGKIGVGAYGLQEDGTDPTLFGGGLNFALGADYFFSRHFGVGVEFNFKDIQYTKESRRVNGDDVVSDLRRHLNRDSRAVLFTLTIQ